MKEQEIVVQKAGAGFPFSTKIISHPSIGKFVWSIVSFPTNPALSSLCIGCVWWTRRIEKSVYASGKLKKHFIFLSYSLVDSSADIPEHIMVEVMK